MQRQGRISSWVQSAFILCQLRRHRRDVAPRDGSPDDLEEMQDDQDTLTPSVFEQGTTGRGVHIRVSGGNPTGTPDFPDGVASNQTVDTNAPLFGQSPPYVDFILPKDDKPFYFPDAKENRLLSDNPSRKTNGVHWDATLSLVGVRRRNVANSTASTTASPSAPFRDAEPGPRRVRRAS